jgi:hypothetical protein
VLQPVAKIELVLMDDTGSTSAVIVNVPSGSTVETCDASAIALASLVAPMSDAVMVRYRVSWRNQVEAPGVAGSGAAIQHAGVFIFEDTALGSLGLVNVPAIKEDLLVSSEPGAGVLIDQADSRVMALVTDLFTIEASNIFGDVFDALVAAYRQSRV